MGDGLFQVVSYLCIHLFRRVFGQIFRDGGQLQGHLTEYLNQIQVEECPQEVGLGKQPRFDLLITPHLNVIERLKGIVRTVYPGVAGLPQTLQPADLVVQHTVHRLRSLIAGASSPKTVVTGNVINHERVCFRILDQVIHRHIDPGDHLFRFILRCGEVGCVLLGETFCVKEALTSCKSEEQESRCCYLGNCFSHCLILLFKM